MDDTRLGRRRLVAVVAAGCALVGALIALQVSDERPRVDGPVRVKGAAVSRASLEGVVAASEGWQVRLTVTVGAEQRDVTVGPDGRYRITNLLSGPAEVSWVARPEASPSTGGIELAAQRTGRTHVLLLPGSNTLDLTP